MNTPRQLLSVVVPVFNEETTLVSIVEAVIEAPLPDGVDLEVIVVDDGSTDRTGAILDDLGDDGRIRPYHQEVNRGKGAAIRRGFFGSIMIAMSEKCSSFDNNGAQRWSFTLGSTKICENNYMR